ncbi:hypothetical protein ATANTOWER_007883 [Ataeniobius toweri]|uniref:Uncharacterized protein n=1 Tax=Ataeniobius toweri TaxID=208326 RepID=A0ABU7AEC1_9TELE|nr:hypothetical protein [Ataeniobius toweri]
MELADQGQRQRRGGTPDIFFLLCCTQEKCTCVDQRSFLHAAGSFTEAISIGFHRRKRNTDLCSLAASREKKNRLTA